MASTIHVNMISDTSLLDVVDDSWREDSLPDDGKLLYLTALRVAFHDLMMYGIAAMA